MCESSKGSVAFLNLEGMSKGNKVCIQRKGIANFTFTVHGVEAHSANCAKLGANAILEAAHKIIELEKLKDNSGITCNCGVISGGTVANTVPGYCEFKANVRFATSEQLEWVKEYMQKVADTVYVDGCRSSVTLTRLRIAMEYSERNQQLFDALNDIFEKEGLSPIIKNMGNGGSDAAEITASGIPCIDSLGVKGGSCHSPNEYGLLSSLSESAKRLAASYFL
jgi:glutamate carboxypeptidase